MFSEVLDDRKKRGTELSTDYHLVICSLRISTPLPNSKLRWSSVANKIKWEDLEDKDIKKPFASSMAAKFRQLTEISENIVMEWSLFQTASTSKLLKAVDKIGLEWRRVVKKKHVGGTKMWKKLSEQRKMLYGFVAKQVIIWFSITVFRGEKNCFFGSRNVERTHFERVWLSVGFLLFICKKGNF